MFDWVPARVWLVLLIGMFAYPQIMAIYRLATNRVQDDLIRTADQQDEVNRGRLPLHICILAGLICLAIFIFTPAAERFARSPQFLPLLMAALTLWMIYFTVSGLVRGEVEPMTRGAMLGPYNRVDHPIRFWLSLGWNMLWTGLMTFLIFKI